MKMRIMVMLMVIAAMATLASATPINNGTLDCPTCVVDDTTFYNVLQNPNSQITDWVVGGTAVVWVREWDPVNLNGWESADGLGSVVGLNATVGGLATWGSVSQTIIDLEPNKTYTLYYSLSAAPGGKVQGAGGDYGYGYRQLNVQVAGTPADIVTYSYRADNSGANMNWEQHAYVFTTLPDQTSAFMTFQSASTGILFGATIDDIYFQEGGVPEPGTLSLMIGAGLAGLAFLKFKRS